MESWSESALTTLSQRKNMIYKKWESVCYYCNKKTDKRCLENSTVWPERYWTLKVMCWKPNKANFSSVSKSTQKLPQIKECKLLSYLHHEDDSVESDQSHDAVLKGRRHHKLPHTILKAEFILWHVACQRLSVNSEIYTRSLWVKDKDEKRCSLLSL